MMGKHPFSKPSFVWVKEPQEDGLVYHCVKLKPGHDKARIFKSENGWAWAVFDPALGGRSSKYGAVSTLARAKEECEVRMRKWK